MIAVPHGYILVEEPPATAVVKSSCREALLRQGILRPDTLLAAGRSASPLSGRGPIASLPAAESDNGRMLVRQYLRGGLLRFINRDIYAGKARPFKELFLARAARNKGIPTPDMLAAVSVRVAPGLYRCYLMSQELVQCRDCAFWLKSQAGADQKGFRALKQDLLIRCAAVIRHMHDCGLYHADLNIKNILVDTQEPESLYVIDWDKSRLDDPLSIKKRRANVLRFCRSLVKSGRNGVPVTIEDSITFLKQYWQHAPHEIGRSTRLLRRSLTVRRLTWKLTTLSPPGV